MAGRGPSRLYSGGPYRHRWDRRPPLQSDHDNDGFSSGSTGAPVIPVEVAPELIVGETESRFFRVDQYPAARRITDGLASGSLRTPKWISLKPPPKFQAVPRCWENGHSWIRTSDFHRVKSDTGLGITRDSRVFSHLPDTERRMPCAADTRKRDPNRDPGSPSWRSPRS